MPATERAFVAGPSVSGDQRVITSPFQFYVTGEDNLRVVSVCSVTGVQLSIRARFVDNKGLIQTERWEHTPNSNRTAAQSDLGLGTGALLGLDVFAASGAPLIGQCFVIVQLVRGVGSGAQVFGRLLAGYVTATQGIGWPGSPIVSSTTGEPAIRAIAGTTPAAGGELSESVPTGARWELIALHALLTTSGVAGNRTPSLVLTASGAIVLCVSQVGNLIPASTVSDLTWGQGMAITPTGITHAETQPIPVGQRLLAGSTITSLTTGLLGGDQYSQVGYVVREWLEVG